MATLIGLFTLGRDAELRTTSGGDPVASLALAYNYGRKGQDGKTPSQWVDGALWGERATKLAEHLTKGSQFYMQLDDLHVETYDKRDGGQGVKLVGRVGQLEFTRGSGQRADAPKPTPKPTPAPKAAGSGFEDMDDDIPFMDPLKRRGYHLAI
jgi:single-strand DNA-binding protein